MKGFFSALIGFYIWKLNNFRCKLNKHVFKKHILIEKTPAGPWDSSNYIVNKVERQMCWKLKCECGAIFIAKRIEWKWKKESELENN